MERVTHAKRSTKRQNVRLVDPPNAGQRPVKLTLVVGSGPFLEDVWRLVLKEFVRRQVFSGLLRPGETKDEKKQRFSVESEE